MINNKSIPLRYKVPLQGKMNKGIFDCINSIFSEKCGYKPTHRQNIYSVVEDIVGFADSAWGTMVIWECKGCGQKQFFHLRENEVRRIDYVALYHSFLTTGKY